MQTSTEFEKRLLGISFFKKEYAKIVTERLDEECFTDIRNKTLFSAIKNLYESQNEIEEVVVSNYLKKINRFKAVGEEAYILEIQENVFGMDFKTLEIYIQEVKQNKYKNKILNLSEEYQQKITSTLELSRTVDIYKEKLEEISSNIATNVQDIQFKKSINKTVDFLGAKLPKSVITHIQSFDEMFDSFIGGTLTTIAGKTGLGKSAFATNIAVKNAVNQKPTLIFSLEMSEIEITTRIISIFSRIQEDKNLHISLDELKECRNNTELLNKLSQLAAKLYEIPLYIVDIQLIANGNYNNAINVIKHYVRMYGIKFVIVDYLQLLDYSSSDVNNRVRALARMSRGFKNLSIELDIPVVILSQLSREADKADRPRRYHLRESGSIEHDSDNIILLHSEEDEPTLIEEIIVIIEKQRAGRVGETKTTFDKRYSFFTESKEPWRN